MTSVVNLLFLPLIVASAEQKTIPAESGQNVTLTCRATTNSGSILAVKWSRADLEPDYVLLYRDEQFVPDNQHPSFEKQVDLQDRQMKDGDVSLILKNVNINDTGTYECRVFISRPVQLISSIYLRVFSPAAGPAGGHREDEGKEDGGKKDGGKEDGGKEDEGKEDGGKEDGGKEDEGKEDGGKEDEGKEDEGKEDGGKEDGGKEDAVSRGHFGLIAVLAVFVLTIAVLAAIVYI